MRESIMAIGSKRNKKIKDRRVSSKHPMVGTWEEDPASRPRTTVVYTIAVKQGKFVVKGKDGLDGTAMKVSRVKWDGRSLSFVSFYPRNTHTASVVFRLRPKRKLSCHVSGTYFDGEPFSVREIWTPRRTE